MSQFALAHRSGVGRTRIQLAEAGYLKLAEKEMQAIERAFAGEVRKRAALYKELLSHEAA